MEQIKKYFSEHKEAFKKAGVAGLCFFGVAFLAIHFLNK